MDLQALEAFAEKKLSSFDEDRSNPYSRSHFSGFEDEYYTGQGDDLVDFGGNASNFAQITADKLFTLNLKNTSITTNGKIYLIPGMKWYPGAAGAGFLRANSTLVATYADGTGSKTILTSAVPMADLDLLYSWIAANPILCYAIRIQASNSLQLQEAITIRHLSPFRTLDEKYLYPSAYLTQDSFQTNILMFETPGLILSGQTQIEMNMIADTANATLSVTFFCGANINTAKALETKITKASGTLSKLGAGSAVSVPGGSKSLVSSSR